MHGTVRRITVAPSKPRPSSPLAIIRWSALGAIILGLFVTFGVDHSTARASDSKDGEAAETPADVAEKAFEALITGQYRLARSQGKQLAALEGQEALGLWIQVRAILESDHPKHATALLEGKTDTVASHFRLHHEYGQLQITTGDYAGAEATGRALLAKEPKSMRAMTLVGESLFLRGQYEDAITILTTSADDGERVKIEDSAKEDFDLAEEMFASGWAAYRINDLHRAQARFDVGRRAFRRHAPCLVGLGRIFYETSKDASARQNYCEAVYGSLREDGFNPNYAPAHYIAALTYFFRWNGGEADASMQKAMRANRFHTEILAARAGYLVTSDQYEEGLKAADRALEVNPNHVETLAVKALHAATLGDKEGYAALEARVLAINPRPGDFYQIVADGLSSRHRFDESIPLYRKGIELDPRRWTLYREMGRALLNMGDHVEGEKALAMAHKFDVLRNSVHTYNLLELLGTYKYFKRFEMADGQYSVLIYEDEVDIVEPYYRRELERVSRELTAKYNGFAPAKPVVIESFHRHRDFEVRTVGIEGLPALGACFGRLVTLDSPSARPPGSYNWASTLWHEMDHVYQLQMSNGQIPRWLAEGCSVYEEGRNRPEWERHMELELYNTYASDGLPKVKEFNTWFGDGSRVLFAYYLGSVMVDFIVKYYGGYETVITMIREFAAKKTPDQVFGETLKINTEEFDTQFREFVGRKVSRIRMLKPVKLDQIADLQIKAEDGEASTAELVTLARAYVQTGRAADARIWAGMAKARGVDSPELNFVLGMLAGSEPALSQEARAKRQRELFTRAFKQGLEDYNLFMQMAQYAAADGDTARQITLLERAADAFATNPAPLMQLYNIYLRAGNAAAALEKAEKAALLDENNLQLRDWLLARYKEQGNHAKIADMAMQIIYVNPFLMQPHADRARSLRELGQWEDAVFEWEMFARTGNRQEEVLARTEARVTAEVEKVRTWIAAKDFRRAEAALLDAQAAAKGDPKVAALRAEIDAAKAAPEQPKPAQEPAVPEKPAESPAGGETPAAPPGAAPESPGKAGS